MAKQLQNGDLIIVNEEAKVWTKKELQQKKHFYQNQKQAIQLLIDDLNDSLTYFD